MTVNVVFGKTSDGYLHNYDVNYTTARNGPADGVTQGNTAYYGQNNNGGQYAHLQAMIGFDYTAIAATEQVTSAVVRVYTNVTINAAVARHLEMRGYGWSSGGLVVGDFRTGTQLAALALFAQVSNINAGANSKYAFGGSDEMLTAMASVVSMEYVLVTNRQRAGTVPTSDEGMAIYSADAAGTTEDPALIFTTATKNALFGCLGAQVTLSDGMTAFVWNANPTSATPTYNLRVVNTAGVTVSTTAFTVGSASNTYATPTGAQGIAICVDKNDVLYMFGRSMTAKNSLACVAFTRIPGGGYTNGAAARLAAMPSYDTSINNVAAAWHDVAGGTIVVLVGHTAGIGVAGSTGNELSYAILNAPTIVNGAGTLVRASGSGITALLPGALDSTHFNAYTNETGTGLDVVADRVNTTWGYVSSFLKKQIPGTNASIAMGRYVLNGTGTAFEHASYEDAIHWSLKDANAKIRVVPLGAGVSCLVSADSDAGWGLSVSVRQHSGATPGSIELGNNAFANEGMATMPDGPVIGKVPTWDAVYNETENRVWLYYIDAANPRRLMRTAWNLTTMTAQRNEVQVYLHASPTAVIQSVRVTRNKSITQNTIVSMGVIDGASYTMPIVVDTFNLAPTAPTLTPRANYDPAVAALFDWTFNDPNPSDTQGSRQVEISRVSDGVVAHDTGKVASAVSEYTLAGGTLVNGTAYQWRVKTWDALDLESPWSSYGTFTVSAGGTVTIIDPVTDNQFGIITDDYPVKWSVAGTVQAAYRVILFRETSPGNLSTISDTGWLASTATTHTVSGMLSDNQYEVWVKVRNASAVESAYGTRRVLPSFATPEVPLLSVQANAEEGYVLLSVENPTPGAPAAGFPEHSFEVDTEGFVAFVGTRERSTEQAHRGAASMKLIAAGGAQAYARGPQQLCVPGQRYTCRAWFYAPVAGQYTIAIDWATAVGYVSTSAFNVALAAGAWTPVQVSGTCPANADRAGYGPTIPGTPAPGVILYSDEIVLTGASDRPDVTRNDILRRAVGETGTWEVIGSCSPDGTFRDYEAAAGVEYEYKARGVA